MKKMNRRSFLGLSTVGTGAILLGANGCTQFPSAGSAAEESTTLFQDTASSAAANTSAPADEQTLIANMTTAANKFLDGLDDAQHAQATYVFTDEERFRWHWTIPSSVPRNGLPLRVMTEDQKVLALAILQASVSWAGFQKALNIMSLQRDLGNDPELYYFTIFGTPGVEPWGWRVEGHHLSRHFTVSNGQVAMTPFFLGAWPTTTEAGLRAMAIEEDAALDLVNSLTGGARDAAILQERTFTQHFTQNAARVGPLEQVGLLYGDMTDAQQQLVTEIIETYLEAMPETTAAPSFARINEAGLEQIRFGWAGSMERRNPQYYRLQGPTFLMEYDNSRGGGTHIHSVWRDFELDFGYHLT